MIKGKIIAIAAMVGSFLYVTVYLADDWGAPVLLGLIFALVSAQLVSHLSEPPRPPGRKPNPHRHPFRRLLPR